MIFLKRRALMTRASFNYKTVSGIGSAVLENCVETKFKRLSLFGNSAQGENPSIESPKEIKNSGKYDETSGKYLLDVEVAGKNLVPPELDFVPFGNNDPKTIEFDPKTNSYKLITRPDNFNQVTCYVKFNLKKGIYTITRKIKIDGVDITNPQGLQIIDADTKENLFYQHTGINRKFELKKDTNVLINLGHFTEKTQKEAILCEVQLEKSDVPTPYEPYHEQQTVQLQLDEPLRGIGEYKDVITKDGILRKIGHLEIKGGLIWNDWGNQFRIIVYVEKGVIIYSKYLCNYTNDVKNFGNQNYVYLYFTRKQVEAIGINTNDTLEVANKKLNEIVANKPIVIEYPLKTPIFVPFPQETKLALENLHANDGTTIINVDSGEVETGIEVEYAVKE